MARKSTARIELEMYEILEPFIVGKIKGVFYPSDCRPLDARTEDAVLTVSNASADQIQEGRARLNIFVPDIDNGSGRPVPDKARLDELSILDEAIIETLNAAGTDYLFDLFKATETVNADDIKQHFVNVNIEFKYVTF